MSSTTLTVPVSIFLPSGGTLLIIGNKKAPNTACNPIDAITVTASGSRRMSTKLLRE